jgi:glycosyltransferase involved in cell wall biosynthesis
MPKVSVVIPTYNRAHFISDAIQSILTQSFRDSEIIIIGDGSTDNTAEVVSAFPVIYSCEENKGVSVARNRGIELAQGEYIAFLDSDDIFMEDALAKGVEVLDKHPEVGFSCGQMYIADEMGRILKLEKAPLKHSCVRQGKEDIRELLIFGHHFTTSTAMVRKSCLDEVGLFDPSFSYGSEDIDLFVRLAKRYAVAYIAEPLVKYRYHSQDYAFHHNLQVGDWEIGKRRVLEDIFNDAELGPIFSHLKPNAYFNLYFSLGGRAHQIGSMKIARDYLFKALKIHPNRFFSRLWLPWIILFAKTWIPLPILAFARRIKHRLIIAALNRTG